MEMLHFAFTWLFRVSHKATRAMTESQVRVISGTLHIHNFLPLESGADITAFVSSVLSANDSKQRRNKERRARRRFKGNNEVIVRPRGVNKMRGWVQIVYLNTLLNLHAQIPCHITRGHFSILIVYVVNTTLDKA